MFICDVVADLVLGQIAEFHGDFFMQMSNTGFNLFTMNWVQSVVLFFSYLAWALYGVELYKLSVSLQGELTAGITRFGKDIGTAAGKRRQEQPAVYAAGMKKHRESAILYLDNNQILSLPQNENVRLFCLMSVRAEKGLLGQKACVVFSLWVMMK